MVLEKHKPKNLKKKTNKKLILFEIICIPSYMDHHVQLNTKSNIYILLL